MKPPSAALANLSEAKLAVPARFSTSTTAPFRGTLSGMDRAEQAYRLTLELLNRCDRERDVRVLALAHLGASAMLFAALDPELAEALLATLESQGLIRDARGRPHWANSRN